MIFVLINLSRQLSITQLLAHLPTQWNEEENQVGKSAKTLTG